MSNAIDKNLMMFPAFWNIFQEISAQNKLKVLVIINLNINPFSIESDPGQSTWLGLQL